MECLKVCWVNFALSLFRIQYVGFLGLQRVYGYESEFESVRCSRT